MALAYGTRCAASGHLASLWPASACRAAGASAGVAACSPRPPSLLWPVDVTRGRLSCRGLAWATPLGRRRRACRLPSLPVHGALVVRTPRALDALPRPTRFTSRCTWPLAALVSHRAPRPSMARDASCASTWGSVVCACRSGSTYMRASALFSGLRGPLFRMGENEAWVCLIPPPNTIKQVLQQCKHA